MNADKKETSSEGTDANTRQLVVSVVIATYNGAEHIGRCLDSFVDQSLDPALYEIIIVDNHSSDETGSIAEKYASEYKNFFLVRELRQGVSHARNRGIAESSGEYICFIDDDAYASREWLECVKNAFVMVDPPPAVVGGRILPYYVSRKPSWFDDDFEIRSFGETPRFFSDRECFFGFPESNFCIRKGVLDEVGGFSTGLGPKAEQMSFGEGIDLSQRIARDHPEFWYDPDIVVYHLVPDAKMTVWYVLHRKFHMAYSYQAFRSQLEGPLQSFSVLCMCSARVFVYLLGSVVFVRWFSHKALSDWLHHMVPLVGCFARSVYLGKFFILSVPWRSSVGVNRRKEGCREGAGDF